MRAHFAFLLLLTLVATPFAEAQAQAANREYIILSGGPSLHEWEKYKAAPHDRWWGNFIRSARIRIQELRKAHGPSARITWLVHRSSYARRGNRQDNENLISNIVSVRDKYGVNLVWFEEGAEVIGYLNQGLPRRQVKVASFDFYGHSNSKAFMFDYSNQIDSASKSWLHEDELRAIKRGIFTKDAHIKSWGCHTAESFSKAWKKATGKKMIGAVGKTDYSRISTTGTISVNGRWGG
ncbi:MAG: hypothetical protein WA771_01385 [Chthoniobacterales bacterium]